jgi:hypothetical protein
MDSVISQLDSHYLKQLSNTKSNESTQRFAEVFCVESCFENDTLLYWQLDKRSMVSKKEKEFIEQFRP